MNELERDAQSLRIAEQEFFSVALREKQERIQELETEVRYLRSVQDWNEDNGYFTDNSLEPLMARAIQVA